MYKRFYMRYITVNDPLGFWRKCVILIFLILFSWLWHSTPFTSLVSQHLWLVILCFGGLVGISSMSTSPQRAGANRQDSCPEILGTHWCIAGSLWMPRAFCAVQMMEYTLPRIFGISSLEIAQRHLDTWAPCSGRPCWNRDWTKWIQEGPSHLSHTILSFCGRIRLRSQKFLSLSSDSCER